jgi:trehalose 6-phosphate synthase
MHAREHHGGLAVDAGDRSAIDTVLDPDSHMRMPHSVDTRRFIVVANRLPVTRSRKKDSQAWTVSPGGLVSAMTPLLTEGEGSWVGWHGAPGDAPEAFEHAGISLRPVGLSKTEVDGYYKGFSNRTLWPLYHDSLRTPQFRRRWWWPYVDVNRRFAEAVAAEARPGDIVWVHDYHLQLVPSMVRRLVPGVRIGFFLHIPFPAVELFSRMPWRREVVEGLLGADLVAFQTPLGAQNFIRAARRFADVAGRGNALAHDGRTVQVQAIPISIDTQRFESIARRPETQAGAAQLRERIGNRRILLGVDRLDYTKGIDVRLRSLEEILRRGRHTVDDMVYIQVAVPSRESVDDYIDTRSEVEEMVGRINGEYANAGQSVVHYLRRSLPQDELVAYYLAADVMLVTPLRDGMNLVAKEYLASRVDDNGTLVLSEFAGAANELGRAIMVNPFDIDAMASAIEDGLETDPTHARRAMRAMRRVVRENDVYRWADRFVGALGA